jgi:cytidine deaminase
MSIDYGSLKHLPNEFILLLKDAIEDTNFDGVILASNAERLADFINEDQIGLMLELLPFVRQFSKPEISNFNVSAVIQGVSGNLYFGNNLEFAKESQTFTVHAEQGGMLNAFYHKEKGLKHVVVSYIPCALCRQFMKETNSADTIKIVLPERVIYDLSDLYPHSFGPGDLGIEKPLFSNEKRELKLCFNDNNDSLTQKALEAAKNSYAPYTKNYAGIALQLKNDNRIISGSVIENAAFDINHNPLISALVILNILNISYNSIIKVVLVEEETLTTQENQVRILLNAIASNVELIVKKAVNIK